MPAATGNSTDDGILLVIVVFVWFCFGVPLAVALCIVQWRYRSLRLDRMLFLHGNVDPRFCYVVDLQRKITPGQEKRLLGKINSLGFTQAYLAS